MEIITEKLTNSPSMGEGSREPTDVFQRDFVKGVVSEAMQEWCDSIEKRMWGLQYSLLRQMQHHQVVSVSLHKNIFQHGYTFFPETAYFLTKNLEIISFSFFI